MSVTIIVNECCCHHTKAKTLAFEFYKNDAVFLRGTYIMVTLKEGQSVDFAIVALDSKGRPTTVDSVVITNSNPAAADLFLNPDGVSGRITHLDGGVAQITATMDADLGDGVRTITALGDITCLALEAVTATVNFGVPTP